MTPVPLGPARLDPADCRLSVARDEDVDTFLIGNQRRLRNDDLFLRCSAFQRHADQLAIDQRKIGIRERGARQNRVSGAIDGDIDEVDLAGVFVRAAVGKP